MAGVPTSEEECNQNCLGHEALRREYPPFREGGWGLTSSDTIKGVAYIDSQGLVFGRAVAASARENLSSLLEGLPERVMGSALLDKLKPMVVYVGRYIIAEALGTL